MQTVDWRLVIVVLLTADARQSGHGLKPDGQRDGKVVHKYKIGGARDRTSKGETGSFNHRTNRVYRHKRIPV